MTNYVYRSVYGSVFGPVFDEVLGEGESAPSNVLIVRDGDEVVGRDGEFIAMRN